MLKFFFNFKMLLIGFWDPLFQVCVKIFELSFFAYFVKSCFILASVNINNKSNCKQDLIVVYGVKCTVG